MFQSHWLLHLGRVYPGVQGVRTTANCSPIQTGMNPSPVSYMYGAGPSYSLLLSPFPSLLSVYQRSSPPTRRTPGTSGNVCLSACETRSRSRHPARTTRNRASALLQPFCSAGMEKFGSRRACKLDRRLQGQTPAQRPSHETDTSTPSVSTKCLMTLLWCRSLILTSL